MPLRRLVLPASLMLATAFVSRDRINRDPAESAPTAISDSLKILYIGRDAGWEHYELKPTDGGMTLTSDYDWVDRGRRNHTQLTLTTAKDYALKTFETVRITDTSRTVVTSVEFNGARAQGVRDGKAADVAIPAAPYALSSYF